MPGTEKQIKELEAFFSKSKLPASIQLEPGTVLTDVQKFVGSHLNVLKNNPDKNFYEVFYDRLGRLKK